ncbi:MAG TPA: isoprenylcysteine carboxylmethyltransferase family protein [Candidatus Limnocylindrales bacterium]|nr:isoprenylcysteine carboxylmethyltransferase family protein [Candidatus Limnocylindrales bacterium]
MPSWSRIATRMRVPLGFLFAAAYLWFARPSWSWIATGAAFIIAGLLLRGAAAGHIRKNRELTTTGPYAYTRNPLYLGSVLIAIGFLIAARNPWIAAASLLMFLFVYLPVIRAEEKYLGATFSNYAEYCANVPRLLPRLSAHNPTGGDVRGSFSRELYLKHREYQAALGSALMLLALVIKIFLVNR